jgi:sigma-B regulation protein RsbU (phosphoserine phosphatase)
MQRANVIVTALDGHDAIAAQVAQRLAQAWSGGQSPNIRTIAAETLNDEKLSSIDAAVIVAGAACGQSVALPWLGILQDAGVPVLALLDSLAVEHDNVFEFAGALIDLHCAPGAQLCTLLRGLLHRQSEVRQLRQEVAISQRFHGGLKTEIAKMHEELQLAALVQREFLPREVPSLHGVEFAALWRPTNYVSGDLYDIIRLDEDHVGVFIADAVGHGVPAALMTMVISRSLNTKEISGGSYRLVPPSEVLLRLNAEMIRRQGRTTRFATAVYALFNCRDRIVTLAGAGHPPPVRLGIDGSSSVLETSGGLLGVFADEQYDQIELELDLDDRLIFYTDGFEQAFPTPQCDEKDLRLPTTRYRNEFDQLAKLPTPADMIDAINRRIDDQSGSLHQIDDLTLVCVHAGALASGEAMDEAIEPQASFPILGTEQAMRLRLAR